MAGEFSVDVRTLAENSQLVRRPRWASRLKPACDCFLEFISWTLHELSATQESMFFFSCSCLFWVATAAVRIDGSYRSFTDFLARSTTPLPSSLPAAIGFPFSEI